MSNKLIFRPVADAEFVNSAEWYENKRSGLGLEFIDHIEELLDKIVNDPLRYPVVLSDIREAIASNFPFAVYYRVKPGRVINLSVFHCSRDPAIWQLRK